MNGEATQVNSVVDSGLPDGWSKCVLSDFVAVNPKKIDADTDLVAGFVPMSLAPTDFVSPLRYEEKYWGEIQKKYTNFKDNDVIFAKVTPCFENGKAAVVDKLPNGIGAGSSEFYVLRPYIKEVPSKFLLGMIKTKNFMQDGAGNMTGAVGLRRVPRAFVESFPVLLPPLAEQKQIAAQLDQLLAQVESTKARLDAISTLLKRFRQSVLAAAVSGRLTEEWREDNPNASPVDIDAVACYWADQYKAAGKKIPKIKFFEMNKIEALPDSWINTRVGNVFDVYVGATPSRGVAEYWGGEVPWVSSSEVAFCRISKTKEAITQKGLSNTSTSLHPVGTVMLAMIGQGKTRGQAAILDIEACHNQNTAAIRVPQGFALSGFLYFFLLEQYEETRRVGGGNNQKALNKSSVQSLGFLLPPLEEQTQIVKRVEQLFTFADQIEARVNQAQARVNQLSQSILAKAFRGELTAQWRAENPDLISGENSAAALLEKIKAAQAALKPVKKKPTRNKAAS